MGPLIPVWIIGFPLLLGIVDLIRTPKATAGRQEFVAPRATPLPAGAR